MPVDLDAVIAARSPGALVEATLFGRSVKFAPLTIGILSRIQRGDFENGFAELVPDAEERTALDAIPIDSLDAVLTAVYGPVVGK